jgi:hypothetical protein
MQDLIDLNEWFRHAIIGVALMQDLIHLNEWFRHAITGLAQGAWIVWLRVVGELRVEGSG